MPLFRLVAKRGFNNSAFAVKVLAINVAMLDANYENGEQVNPETLIERGLAKGQFDVIKILGDGELTTKLSVSAHRFSRSAAEKIQAAGGSVEVIES